MPFCSHIRSFSLFLLFFLLLISSCIKEEFDPEKIDKSVEFTPGVAIPLGFIHYRLDEMLNDSTIPDMLYIDNDGFLTLRYYQDVTSFQLSDLLTIPDIEESFSITNTLPAPIPLDMITDSMVISNSLQLNLSLNDTIDTRLDSIWIESLDLGIDISTEYNLNGSVSITSTSILDNGQPLDISTSFNGSNSNQLDNATLVLTNNQLIINYKATIKPSGGSIPAGGTIFEMDFSLTNADYSAIFGYLGKISFSLDEQTIPINFYNSIVEGVFHFEDPKMKLYFDNSYGIPIQVAFSQLDVETRDEGILSITQGIPTVDTPKVINYPGIEEIGESVSDSIILTRTNTDLFTALEKAPREITYGINAMANPPGEDTTNFITKDSKFSASVDLILPLYGYADFVIMMDTIKFEFDDFYNNPPEEIKRLAFRLNFTNGFPVNVIAQMYFIDENYNKLDSLFTDLNDNRRIIVAADDNDGDGKADPFENDPIEIEFTHDKIENISESKFIIVLGRINTTNYEQKENIKFYNDYTFDAYIGVVGDLEVNSTDY